MIEPIKIKVRDLSRGDIFKDDEEFYRVDEIHRAVTRRGDTYLNIKCIDIKGNELPRPIAFDDTDEVYLYSERNFTWDISFLVVENSKKGSSYHRSMTVNAFSRNDANRLLTIKGKELYPRSRLVDRIFRLNVD